MYRKLFIMLSLSVLSVLGFAGTISEEIAGQMVNHIKTRHTDVNFTLSDPDIGENPDVDCIVVGIFSSGEFSESAKHLDLQSKGFITSMIDSGDMSGGLGETLTLFQVPLVQARRVLLVGCGDKANFDEFSYQTALASAAEQLRYLGSTNAVMALIDLPIANRSLAWNMRRAVQVVNQKWYSFDYFHQQKPVKPRLETVMFPVENTPLYQKTLQEAVVIASSTELVRDMANLPPNIGTPTFYATLAQMMPVSGGPLQVEILEREDMEKLGMGSFLAVTKGSPETPPKMVIFKYQGAGEKVPPFAFVGKGITFDSGGISIKSSESMVDMKYDMCGAASVLGLMQAVTALELPVNVIGIMACTLNMPNGTAMVPGDIVTAMNGMHIEILNTDAEGRMILADALTYVERYNPCAVIDIATLTGAAIVALGDYATGAMGNNEVLMQQVLQAGHRIDDPVWQLPLNQHYKNMMRGTAADLVNMGDRRAGAIQGAAFLSNFTENYPWVHLDVAGTAFNKSDRYGATGRPVPLLVQFLMDQTTQSSVE